MTGRTVQITAHALVRWIERVVGNDLKKVRRAALEAARASLGDDAPETIGDADVIEFIERLGFDLEPMRAKIRALAEPGALLAAKTVIAPGGNRLVLAGWCVVTVLDRNMTLTGRPMKVLTGRRA